MDRNQFIGLLLIALILIGYSLYMQKKREQLAKYYQQQYKDTTHQIIDTTSADTIKTISLSDTTLQKDSLKFIQLKNKYGIFANSALGKQQFITIKNQLLEIKISTKGGRIYSVNLLKFKTFDQKPLILFYGDKNVFDLKFFSNNKNIHTKDLYFEPVSTDTIIDASAQDKTIRLRLKGDNKRYVEYVYTIHPNSYLIDFDINFVNLDKNIDRKTTFLELDWLQYIPSVERSKKQENLYTTIFYKFYKDAVEKLNPNKDYQEKNIPTKLRWISFKQQFFSSFFIAKTHFNEATLTMKKLFEDDEDTSKFLKLMKATIILPFNHSANVNIPLMFYFGPNKYSILKKIKIGDDKLKMDKILPLGGSILGWINKFLIIPMFSFLEKYISNYGIIILIMTIVIKLLLFPFTYRSYVSSAKMRVLKPEIDKILAKIPESKQLERQQKMMELYKKAGVSPFGGCLPLLLQLPILIAMYRFFPASIELRQKSFLWAKDLSSYDAFISWNFHIPLIGDHLSLFTLLMAITLVVNSLLTNASMDSSNPQAKTMRFIFVYLFPIMMIVWFNNYSSGLSYYFFLSSLIGILQTLIIRKFIDEEKLLAQLKQNIKTKKIKKSKWQQRLEQMARQQQQMKKRK